MKETLYVVPSSESEAGVEVVEEKWDPWLNSKLRGKVSSDRLLDVKIQKLYSVTITLAR